MIEKFSVKLNDKFIAYGCETLNNALLIVVSTSDDEHIVSMCELDFNRRWQLVDAAGNIYLIEKKNV